MDDPNNKIFRRTRVANVMAGIMIIINFWFIGWVFYETFSNGGIPESNKDMILALIATTSMIGGYALKYLFDPPCGGDKD